VESEESRRARGAAWLKHERERRGTLQGRLAKDLGVSQQSLSGYENGKWTVPDDVAARLAKTWGLKEVDVRRQLGLYVPEEMGGGPIVDIPEWPENALRLPRGMRLSDLDPRDARTLESIVDAFLDSVRRSTEQ
jgi:transcriptional regulator with XRE-family HTH domain